MFFVMGFFGGAAVTGFVVLAFDGEVVGAGSTEPFP